MDGKSGIIEAKNLNKEMSDVDDEKLNETKKISCIDKKVIETFNLTHDCTNGYQLKFDDKNWTNNMSSLKPLGLSILLNTCNEQVSDSYLKLCDFIRLQSTQINSFLSEKSNQCISNMDNNELSSSSSLNIFEEHFEVKAVMDRQ